MVGGTRTPTTTDAPRRLEPHPLMLQLQRQPKPHEFTTTTDATTSGGGENDNQDEPPSTSAAEASAAEPPTLSAAARDRDEGESSSPPSKEDQHPSAAEVLKYSTATAADSIIEGAVANFNSATAAGEQLVEPSSNDSNSISSSQHRADVERATRNSIRDSVGAYSIVPGERATRRDIRNVENSRHGHGENESDPPSGFQLFNAQNLPPNIDIIAEATLVEDNRSDDSRTDAVDTLGLHWEDTPQLGGAYDDSASVAMSAITAPTVARDVNDISSGSRTTGSGQSPHHCPQHATVTTMMSTAPPVDEERGETQGTHTTQSSELVHATPVNDGPLAFLETKGGKIAASIAVISIVVLAIGASVGLTVGNKNSNSAQQRQS